MKQNTFQSLLAVGIVFIMTGCATQYKPRDVPSNFWEQRSIPLGVLLLPVPTPQPYMSGNQGLLDVAINTSMASPLTKRMSSIEISRAKSIPINLASQLSARGFTVKVLDETAGSSTLPDFKDGSSSADFAAKDYRSFKSAEMERLLVVNIQQLGTQRGYYGFIPLGAPSAIFSARGQLIDLNNNKVLWDKKITNKLPIADPWDQAPEYPNLVNAVAINLGNGAAAFERSFFNLSNNATVDATDMTTPITSKDSEKYSAPAPTPAPTMARSSATATEFHNQAQ